MQVFHILYLNVRAAFRLLRFAFVVSLFFLKAAIIYMRTPDPIERRRKLTYKAHTTSKKIIKAFNVELICHQNISEDESALLVGNHMGFIDIVCLCALRNNVFITSLEMKQTPVLGQIAELGGCAYVNRKNRMSIQHELQDIVNVLKQGFRVVLYAESVASDGEQVLPFKKTLIMAAGLAEKPIRPFVFNFRQVNHQPVLFEHRDSVCWYGSETFLPAIWRSLKLDSVTCEIEFLPMVYPKAEDDRSELAKKLHEMVSAKFEPFRPEMNRDASRARPQNLIATTAKDVH